MIKAQIRGIEYYLPELTIDNQQLSEFFPEWPAQQIEEKTGIRVRHIASPDETAVDLAFHAARKLFDGGKCKPDEIDFLVLCTQSPDYFLPTSACLLQNRLGLKKNTGAFDFNLGCSGFIYGISIAQGLIETGSANNVLLITAETYSKFMHPKDKGTRTLFGDGAAATIIRGVESEKENIQFIGPSVFGTDGSGADALIVRSGGMRQRNLMPVDAVAHQSDFPSPAYLYMDGPAIFSFTLKVVPEIINTLLQKMGITKEDVDLYVFHQANKFMLDALRKQIGIPPDHFVISLAEKGNTVSSTIPIALLDAHKAGKIIPDSRIMLVGFGVGLSWAATMVSLPHGI